MKIGDKATVTRSYGAAEVKAFAELTGDFNPVHFDEAYAAQTIFGKPIVHGPLVLTLITTLFANELPGPGSVYLSHEVRFMNPVYYNDVITATLEITAINEKGHIFIRTSCVNQEGTLIIDGTARLKKY